MLPPPLKIKPESLAAHLRERLLPVYLMSGDDPLLTGEAVDAMRAARARDGVYRARGVLHRPGRGLGRSAGLGRLPVAVCANGASWKCGLPTGQPGLTGAKVLKRVIDAPATIRCC